MAVLTLRPYQQEALDAVDAHVRTSKLNPCIVLPTGSGKSFVIASMINRWKEGYPPLRVCILAHRKELIGQNYEEFMRTDTFERVGIYSAGLKKRDTEEEIIFASIDSIYEKAGHFAPFDLIVVDEAHHIPQKDDGKYRSFLKDCKQFNHRLVVVGVTATPFRMGSGQICHKDHVLQKIVYEANVANLIAQGYLCKLRSRIDKMPPSLENVKRNSGGDYIIKSLAEAIDKKEIVQNAVSDALRIIKAEERKKTVWFCLNVEHCKHVQQTLRTHGINAPAVTGNTPTTERDMYVKAFRNGQTNHLLNVNVFTEGFNVKDVDCIVLLRPTLSKGLYSQMVGRGLRVHPNKQDCLVLDYAGCILEHGPIDALEGDAVKIQECAGCGDSFSFAVGKCPHCGWQIPKGIREAHEREETRRRIHAEEIQQAAILAAQPQLFDVDDVTVSRHKSKLKDSPDSMKVTYRCGLLFFSEWLFFSHTGYVRQKSEIWWAKRFDLKVPTSTDEALQEMFLDQEIKGVTQSILVVKKGKYDNIVDHILRRRTAYYHARTCLGVRAPRMASFSDPAQKENPVPRNKGMP